MSAVSVAVAVVQMVKGMDVMEIQHNRYEGVKLPKIFKGSDAVKVLAANGRVVVSDIRCLDTKTAEKTVKDEVTRLALQGWALVEPEENSVAA